LITKSKWRPIHFLCQYGTPETIKYLIDKGVNLKCETYNKTKPIYLICRFSTPDMLKYMCVKLNRTYNTCDYITDHFDGLLVVLFE